MNPERPTDEIEREMDRSQFELFQRIQAFSLDQQDAPLSFSKRLARDNGWSLEYAQRVIEEYKKFVFLAVAAGHPVTPSDQIDQVWHLHLSYTRSYWEEFCPKVLQMPLHHDPTRGGQAENEKFEDWYRKTLASYERFFRQAPPTDVWTAPETRFGKDLQYLRVNTEKTWVLPKLQTRRKVIAAAIVSLALVAGGYYAGTSGQGSLLAWLPLILIFGTAGLGVFSTLVGIINTLRYPSRRSYGSPFVSGGCGWGGGWEENHFSSDHHSAGDFSSFGDSGGCGGGCGGSGCGGG
jgi:hypothetical protein